MADKKFINKDFEHDEKGHLEFHNLINNFKNVSGLNKIHLLVTH
jgi:hypothetical protein